MPTRCTPIPGSSPLFTSSREGFFSEIGLPAYPILGNWWETLLSLVLYRTYLTVPAKRFRTCDKCAQPYAARGKASNHITKVVHPKVHPAEADEEHQQRCPKDDCRPSPPALQGQDSEVGQHPVAN